MRDHNADEDGGEEEKQRKRNHAAPVPDWWRIDARAAMRDQSITQMQSAARLGKMLPEAPSQSQISLCLKGRTTTIELVNAMSAILGLPPPVLIAASRMEAIALAQERLRYQAHLEMSAIEAEIAEVERGNTEKRRRAARVGSAAESPPKSTKRRS